MLICKYIPTVVCVYYSNNIVIMKKLHAQCQSLQNSGVCMDLISMSCPLQIYISAILLSFAVYHLQVLCFVN